MVLEQSPSAAVAEQTPVLVVEDDLSTASAMRVLLEHFGFSVTHARTMTEALRQLSGAMYQYVFLDLMLPDGDGVRVLEQIRRSGMKTRVAVITGTTDGERLKHVESLKPDMLLRKPLDFLALLEQIKPAR